MRHGRRPLRGAWVVRRLSALGLAVLAFGVAAAPAAAEPFSVSGAFCPNGTRGGECGTAVGRVAINTSGAGGVPAGTVYVAENSNNRVERLSPNGAFERAWGFNVSGRDERQFVKITGASGSFTLSFGACTTGSILVTNTAPTVQTALNAAAMNACTSGAGNITVTGGPATTTGYTIRFIGALSGTDVESVVVNGGGLTGTPVITQETLEQGSGGNSRGFETCTVAANCQDGTAAATSANGGQLGGPQGIGVNQANGHVYVVDNGSRRIEEFDADGNFVRGWGEDVVEGGAGGSGVVTSGSATVTSVTTTSKAFVVGQTITGTGIAAGTTIAALGAGTITLSQPATAAATGASTPIAVATGAGNATANETQTVTLSANSTGGTFTLTFTTPNPSSTTATATAIPFNATAAELQAKLEGLSNVGAGNVAVAVLPGGDPGGGAAAGGPWAVTFQGTRFADTNVAPMTSSAAGLTGTGTKTATVATTAGGTLAFERCAAAAECKSATEAGTNGGQFGNTPRSLVVSPSGDVWVADTENRRFQKFDSTGNFLAVYGFNVNGGGAIEACTSTAAGVCKAGTAGEALGQFTGLSPFMFAFDSAGNLFADNAGGSAAGKRVEKCSFSGPISCSIFYSNAAIENNSAVVALPEGHLLITLNCNATVLGECSATSASERRLRELDGAGAAIVPDSLAGAGFTAPIAGLAQISTSGRVYATTNIPGNTLASAIVLTRGAAPPPGITVNPVTAKTASSATFSATVDPKGATISSCSFEYSTDQASWTPLAVPSCSALAPGGGAQPVGAEATGLVPNTQYFLRLSVKRLLIPGTATSAPPVPFSTEATAPGVADVGAINPSDTAARFAASIDPRNSGTAGYSFEYGTTPALGQSTPAGSVPNGTGQVLVSQLVSGLTPGATYYLRVRAANTTGTTFSPFVTFLTRSHAPEASNRSYEMVSPPDKNGGGALAGSFRTAAVAYDGKAVGYCTTSIFGKPPAPQTAGCGGSYVSRRGPGGWSTTAATPLVCAYNLETSSPTSLTLATVAFSRNIDRGVLAQPEEAACALPPLDPAAPLPATNLYLEALGAAPGYQLLTPQPAAKPEPGNANLYTVAGGQLADDFFGAASDDFGHVVYRNDGKQTADAAAAVEGVPQLYEYDHGVLRLVSKDPAGNAFATASSVPIDRVNGVSSGGERIYFQNPATVTETETSCVAPACELYLREGGSATYDVSETECTSACGATAADRFLYAATDGSRTFFATNAKLVDGDDSAGTFSAGSGFNNDLYMFTKRAGSPAGEPDNLTLLSKDREPGDGVNADVKGVLGADDSGETVFFAAGGQIVPGKPTAAGPKLYRWSWNAGSPSVEYLGTLAGGDSGNWEAIKSNDNSRALRQVTPDGRHLLVRTAVRLSTAADADADADFYRWSQADGWVCVSCQLPGAASAGAAGGPEEPSQSAEARISISDDGQQVFFVSRDRLVPGDENGAVKDVYEWDEGVYRLVSTGTEPSDMIRLLGASHTGDDVFFDTEQRLVGWDVDSAGDIYDYRVGGGFPEPPEAEPGCEGEACRGAASSPPPATGAGTAAFQGPGNPLPPAPKKTCPKGTRRVTVKGKQVCKKRRRHSNANRHRRASNHRRASR
jgi:hypothetical protein